MSNEVMTRNSEWMNHIVNHLNRMVDNFERAVMNYRPMLGGERFMTDKELCARLQLSRRTLQDYRNNGVIPVYPPWRKDYSTASPTFRRF